MELGALATLLASFLTVALPLPHVATATAWVALTFLHAVRRLRRVHRRHRKELSDRDFNDHLCRLATPKE